MNWNSGKSWWIVRASTLRSTRYEPVGSWTENGGSKASTIPTPTLPRTPRVRLQPRANTAPRAGQSSLTRLRVNTIPSGEVDDRYRPTSPTTQPGTTLPSTATSSLAGGGSTVVKRISPVPSPTHVERRAPDTPEVTSTATDRSPEASVSAIRAAPDGMPNDRFAGWSASHVAVWPWSAA